MLKNVILATMLFGMVGCVSEESSTEVSLPITSQAELNAYLKNEPTNSPLRQLSEPARQRFINSLRFGESGVGSFSYSDLQLELHDAQARSVLRLFDLERSWDVISPPQGVVKPMPPQGMKDM
jgi:hypothetical protein